MQIIKDFSGTRIKVWTVGVSFKINEFCYYTDGNFYLSLEDDNRGNQPDVSPTKWQVVSTAIVNAHVQNTDTKLDEGGADEVTANEIRALLDSGIEGNMLSYGARFDKSTNTWIRLGRTAGQPTGVTLADNLIPIQAAMHGCVVDDSLNLKYLLNDLDHTKKADGSAASLDGTDGQALVQVPKFYYKLVKVSADIIDTYVSFQRLPGYKVSPMHYRNGKELDYAYVGKYPGVLWDDSASAYVDGDGTVQADPVNDKLSSVSGFKPFSNQTRAEFRQMTQNRGSKFFQFDAATRASLLLLLITEYATGNFQAAISAGNTQFASWDFATCISATGKSNSDGMVANGQSTTDGDATDYIVWRGIEDLWGNLMQWLDGLNVYNVEVDGKSYAYFCDNPSNFADNTTTNYENVEELSLADGYQKMIGYKCLPTEVGGASNTHFADYFCTYYGNLSAGFVEDWRVALVGGDVISGSIAGAFCLSAHRNSAFAHSSIGGRLCAADI